VRVLLTHIIQMQRRQLAEDEQRLYQLFEWRQRYFPSDTDSPSGPRGNNQQEYDHNPPNSAENLWVLSDAANQPVSNLETKVPQQPNEEPYDNVPNNAENISGLNTPVNQATINLEIKAPQQPT